MQLLQHECIAKDIAVYAYHGLPDPYHALKHIVCIASAVFESSIDRFVHFATLKNVQEAKMIDAGRHMT